MPSLNHLFRVLTQGALALMPAASPAAVASAQQYLRGQSQDQKPALSIDTHAHYHRQQEVGGLRDGGGAAAINLGSGDLTWTGDHQKIRVNGQPFHLKGISWFGFELQQGVLLGLEQRPLDSILQFLVDNKFNALRIPWSTKWALDYDHQIWGNFKDSDINGMTRRQLLNKVIARAADFNILVMLDSHRLNDQEIPELWYSNEFSEEQFMEAWDIVLGDTKKHWNLFAIDLKNEPHGQATWGDGSDATDWNKAAERLGRQLLEAHPEYKGLIFIEGIVYSIVFNVQEHPIKFGNPALQKRLVYSPHQYGPSVTGDAHFGFYAGFPENQLGEWERTWGFIQKATGTAVVLGEWGGQYRAYHNEHDMEWQNRFAEYLVDKCLSDQFVWDLNPESGDTGGVLRSDWWQPEEEKLKLYDSVQPNPSSLSKGQDGNFYLTPGAYAKAACARK